MGRENFLSLDSVRNIAGVHNGSIVASRVEKIAHGTHVRYFFIDPNGHYREVLHVSETEQLSVRGKRVGGKKLSPSFFNARRRLPHRGLYQATELTQLIDPSIELGQFFLVLANGQD